MISIKHLSKTFKAPDGKSLQVLKDVNCDIEKGEVISIIGPSQAAKFSSMVRISCARVILSTVCASVWGWCSRVSTSSTI